MVKLRVNPLVLAAALGLVGPAALDEDVPGPLGVWRRDGPDPDLKDAGLGDRIEVVAVEDRVFIDEGLGAGLADHGTWTRLDDGVLVQELQAHGAHLRREFRADADNLAVRTWVEVEGERRDFQAHYTRLG